MIAFFGESFTYHQESNNRKIRVTGFTCIQRNLVHSHSKKGGSYRFLTTKLIFEQLIESENYTKEDGIIDF